MKRAEKWLPVIDSDLCSGCGVCANFCARDCLEIPLDCSVLRRPSDCTSDGLCARVCPQGAIEMGWVACEELQTRGHWRTNPIAARARMPGNHVRRYA
jgi:2-oxoglutarate ferredoxin oxidoreductase subunit delta